MQDEQPMWRPSPQLLGATLLTKFTREAERVGKRQFSNYVELWRWSINEPEAFWRLVWSFTGVLGDRGSRVVVESDRMPGARWFPEAKINYAQNLLSAAPRASSDALIFWGEDKVRRSTSYEELVCQVSMVSAALREQGIGPGDCIAAYLPNMPETIIAMLAAASIGAVFTSISPDFGVSGVLDRLGQTQPRVIFAVDGYWYNRVPIHSMPRLAQIVSALPSVERVVLVSYLGIASDSNGVRGLQQWDDFIAPYAGATDIEFAALAFNHPLYVLYSSGTTGVPKGILHGAGGILLQHLKEWQLHHDLRPGDRLFYFTTCGWMMWNALASGLACGATLLLYDGSPLLKEGRILFELAQAERATHFGTSAKFIDALAKSELKPREEFDLTSVRLILSTGSPLAPEGYDYVYRDVTRDARLSSISGGTDICSAFVLGSPNLPVWRGEIQCRGLGMAVEVFDEEGEPLRGAKGELVCTRPFPSMPVGFLNDPDGSRYRAAYFMRFDNVWCHGDFAEITPHDGVIIYGRSDATLNPGGVRIGTAEIYRQVEKLPQIIESVAVAQEWPPQEPCDVRVVLFVKLRDGLTLDDELVEQIKSVVRENTTPRHVPAKILQVGDIPRTKSGKLVELAVCNVMHGRAVKNLEALANPEALEEFRGRVELRF